MRRREKTSSPSNLQKKTPAATFAENPPPLSPSGARPPLSLSPHFFLSSSPSLPLSSPPFLAAAASDAAPPVAVALVDLELPPQASSAGG